MKISKRLALAAIFLCLSTMAGLAEAKDVFFLAGYDKMFVIDGDKDELIKEIPVEGFLRGMAITKDKKFAYANGSRRALHKVDLEQGKVVKTLKFDSNGWERLIYGFQVDNQAKTAYLSFFSRKLENGQAYVDSPSIAQVDLNTGEILRSVDIPYGTVTVVLGADGQKVYAVGQDIITIDVSGKDMAIVDTFPMFDKGYNTLPLHDFTDENDGIFLGHYYSPTHMGFMTIDTHTGKITDTPLPGVMAFAYGFTYNADKTKAIGVMDEIYVIDLKTKTMVGEKKIHSGTKFTLNVSSDDKKIYVGGGGSVLAVYDAETLKLIKEIHVSTDGGFDLKRVDL